MMKYNKYINKKAGWANINPYSTLSEDELRRLAEEEEDTSSVSAEVRRLLEEAAGTSMTPAEIEIMTNAFSGSEARRALEKKYEDDDLEFKLENQHYKPGLFELGILKALIGNKKSKQELRKEIEAQDTQSKERALRGEDTAPTSVEAGQLYAKRQLAAPYVTKKDVLWSNIAAPALGLLLAATTGGAAGATIANVWNNNNGYAPYDTKKVSAIGGGLGALLGALIYGARHRAVRNGTQLDRREFKNLEENTNWLKQLAPKHNAETNERRATMISPAGDYFTDYMRPIVDEQDSEVDAEEQKRLDKEWRKLDEPLIALDVPHSFVRPNRLDEEGNVVEQGEPLYQVDRKYATPSQLAALGPYANNKKYKTITFSKPE